MSASGPALFDDDLACDVRDIYRRMLQDRVPDEEATRRSIEEWAGLSPDEEPVFWLALASAQSSCGRLNDQVRSRALEVIDSGGDVARWEGVGPEPAAARAAVLAKLREQLTRPQPPRKAIRRPWRYVTDLEPGMALAWTASNGSVALFRVVQIIEDAFARTFYPVLERLAWSSDQLPTSDAMAASPAGDGVLVSEPEEWTYGGGRLPHPAGCIVFKLRERDPDWADLGFVRCGYVPRRPGDDGDWQLLTVGLEWSGLAYHLEEGLAPSPDKL